MEVNRFNDLVREHTSRLYALAYRLTSDRHMAEDIVQETFKSVWKTKKEIDKQHEKAWLSVILRRRYIDMKRARPFPLTSENLEIEVSDPNYVDNFSRNVQDALNKLDEDIKETLLLVVVNGLTHDETARVLQIPLGTVLSRVNRARNQLRKMLQSQECYAKQSW